MGGPRILCGGSRSHGNAWWVSQCSGDSFSERRREFHLKKPLGFFLHREICLFYIHKWKGLLRFTVCYSCLWKHLFLDISFQSSSILSPVSDEATDCMSISSSSMPLTSSVVNVGLSTYSVMRTEGPFEESDEFDASDMESIKLETSQMTVTKKDLLWNRRQVKRSLLNNWQECDESTWWCGDHLRWYSRFNNEVGRRRMKNGWIIFGIVSHFSHR